MFKKKSVMSKVLLGILCCTACGNSSNIDFLENNKDQLNIYHTDGKTIISQQHLSEMDKDYSILENVRDSSEVIIKGTVMRQEGTFVARGGAPWTFYGVEIEEVLRGNMEDKTIVVGEQQGYSTLKEKIEKYPDVLAERVLEEYKVYTEEELENIYLYESNGSPLLTEGDTLILALVNKNLKGLDGDFWAITAEAYGKFYESADKNYKRIVDDYESETYSENCKNDINPKSSQIYSYEELENAFR